MNKKRYKQSHIPVAELPDEWKGIKLQQLKCIIDGAKENIRLAVQFQKGGKYYYNIEINIKKPTPKRSNA